MKFVMKFLTFKIRIKIQRIVMLDSFQLGFFD
jgi:hypothetical protein